MLSPQFNEQVLSFVRDAQLPRVSCDDLAPIEIPRPPLVEQRRLVAELDAEAAQMEAVRGLIPRFEAKIQRVLDRVWGNGTEATE